ncbi:MAG TPA: class I SAM-dependent methyltransferase, partial [Vicinamibacterales bacterium]|nr:class I SAM-dependent methyltransferase [Vicinamibacterales bacterium]
MPDAGRADAFDRWVADLERRHLAELTFPEVARSLRALSATYVERRQKLGEGAALVGAGKRAAFALFYGPLHFLLVSHIVRQLPGATRGITTLLDLGCGTGASGAAWASHCEPPPRLVAIDRHPWAVAEAAHICRAFGVKAATRRADVAAIKWPTERAAILAAFTVNELSDESRSALRDRLLERAARGDRVLVVEPIAGFVARWWNGWRDGFEGAGGRADEWRVRAPLPAIVAKLDRAAGMNHGEITGRSLWIG